MLLVVIILSLLCIAGIWVATWFFSLPIWIGIVVTSGAILLVVGIIVFRRIRAVMRAGALERELLKQASQQADQANPQRRAQILELQSSMRSAIAALKATKLGARGGKAALYALPWYVVVGPPAAGKTTALEQSGLAFSTPGSGGRSKIKGTAGTKNCDWWFSKEAILLDTAGRFAMEDDDQEEWLAFLDTIRRFRPERPLDGIVVALSAADLINLGESQLEDLATKLRARVDEVMNRLQMVVPMYVMVTKADLIAGFVEFWGDLGKQQRGQAWGATFALDDERLESDVARACEAEFDVLVQTLHARMLERLPQERVPDTRARILQFPVEFRALRPRLAHFIEELCRANPYQETPILRGYYFTSGTQVGRPIDVVLANMVRGFDLRLGGMERAGATQPVSYFVTDLFRGIVFPDRHIAIRSASRLREHVRRQIIGSVAALLITMLVVVPAALNYARNVQLVRDTREDVEEVLKAEGNQAKGAPTLRSLDVLNKRVLELETAKAGFRIPGWFGYQAAAAMHEPARALYVQRLRDTVEGPVRDQVKKDVRSIADGVRGDAQSFKSSYESLRLYWMLSTPKELDVEWASSKLAEKWARSRSDSNLDPDKLKGHTSYYVKAFSEAFPSDPKWIWPLDPGTMTRARDRLCQVPLEQLQYSALLSKAEGVAPIRPEEIIVGPSAQFIVPRARDVVVEGAYTIKGWEAIRPALDNPDEQLSVDPKVLACPAMQGSTDARRANTDNLREMYFKQYERAWSQFLAGLQVKAPSEVPPGDIQTAIEELSALADSDGPYRRLFRVVSDNARLDAGPSSLVGKGLDKAKELGGNALDKAMGKDAGAQADHSMSPVEKHFRRLIRFASGDSAAGGDGQNSGLQQYLDQLNKLSVVLRQLKDSKAEPTAEFQQELARAKVFVEVLLGQLDAPTRQLLEPLLMNPIRGSGGTIDQSLSGYLGEKWKGEVWDIYSAKIAPRYPFVDARDEVALPEFVDFFRPATGLLWKFFDKSLADRIERKGNAFSFKSSTDPAVVRPDLLRCLGVAQEITDAVFTSTDAAVAFEVKMQSAGPNVSEITFKVDGQAIVYKNEPEKWVPMQWPGKGSPHGAFLQVKGAGGLNDELPRAGDFGLFRLLAAGGIKPSGAGLFAATWNLNRPGVPAVTVEFKSSKSVQPFARDFFSRLKCPQEITPVAAGHASMRSP